MSAWDTMRAAVNEASSVLAAADNYVWQMAAFLRGRLRKCHHSDLVALKRELRNYDAQRRVWK